MGAAEMGTDRDASGPVVEQIAKRRERCADARVVRDSTVLEWDVEIGADEDASSRHVRVAYRARPLHL